jgi:putative heme-binding domain-containing protein
LNSAQAINLVAAVMQHENVVGDPFLPQLCWWVFEAHLRNTSVESDDVTRFFHEPGVWDLPVVFNYILPRIARRYGVEGKRADLLRCAELVRMAPSPRHAAQLMAGLEEAFRGRSMSGLPDELVEAIARSGQAPLVFRVRQSDPTAVREALARLQDPKVNTQDRIALIRAFGETRNPGAVPVLLGIVGDTSSSALRKAVFGALSVYDDDALGARVSELLPKLEDDSLSAAIIMLSSRPSWSARLLDAVKEGVVNVSSIPHEVVLRLRASKDDGIRGRAVRILPEAEPEPVPAEFQSRIAEIPSLLQQGPGNPYVGEALFTARCAACHKLFFKGGNIGPDLTPYQRDNLSTMLLSIIDPSAEIREGYQGYSVVTKDGRDLTGFVVDRDNQVVVLRGLDGENVTLRLSDIIELEPMGRSLMPNGLLDDMTEQQLRDFFAYLRISQPITN